MNGAGWSRAAFLGTGSVPAGRLRQGWHCWHSWHSWHSSRCGESHCPDSVLPNEKDDRCGEERRHGAVEDGPGAVAAQPALHRGAEGEPEEAAGKGGEDEEQTERRGLGECAS